MKKFLLIIFFFLTFFMPVFSAESDNNIFIDNISKEQTKKAIIGRALSTNWQVKNDNEYSLDIYRVKNDNSSMLLYGTNFNMHPEQRVHFSFYEKNKGVYLSHTTTIVINPNSGYEKTEYAPLLDFAVNNMLNELFIGETSYYINYKIKKNSVLISDTPQTSYTNKNRIGKKFVSIIKIDDKCINEYTKAELKAIFNNCTKDKIKLESSSENGAQIYYLIRSYTAPTYKQYL